MASKILYRHWSLPRPSSSPLVRFVEPSRITIFEQEGNKKMSVSPPETLRKATQARRLSGRPQDY
jgi:hypothetical protein